MKKVPKHNELSGGRLIGKLTGLSNYIMDACPTLKFCIRSGFVIKKPWRVVWRGDVILWWERLNTAFERGLRNDFERNS